MEMTGGKTRGFTLIELMIVVAAVAILAAVALPSYNDAVRKSRRGQAKADITEYAQAAERFHTVNNTYLNFDTTLALPNQSPREVGAVARYNLNYAATQNTFTITATATPGNGQDNDACGNLSINQAGLKTNSKGALSQCW